MFSTTRNLCTFSSSSKLGNFQIRMTNQQHIGVDLSSSSSELLLSRTNTRSFSILQNTPTTSQAPLLIDDVIEIKIIKANSLMAADLNGFSDPYCEVYVHDDECHGEALLSSQPLFSHSEQPPTTNAHEKSESPSFHFSSRSLHITNSPNETSNPKTIVFKTNVIKKNLDPQWNESFTLNPLKDYTEQVSVKFTVMDWDRFSKDVSRLASRVFSFFLNICCIS